MLLYLILLAKLSPLLFVVLAHASPLVFQVGFNKAGTSSLAMFMKKSIFPFEIIHGDRGHLAATMFLRKERGHALIDMERYNNVAFFSDMEAIFAASGTLPFEGDWDGQSRPSNWLNMGDSQRRQLQDARRFARGRRLYAATLFKDLDEQYPNSLYILNLRNRSEWVQSRLLHPYYLLKSMLITGMNPREICETWEQEYDNHIDNVLAYFTGDKRERLLIYDLSEGDVAIGLKLKLFLQPHFPNAQFSLFDFTHHNANTWAKDDKILKIRIPGTGYFRHAFFPNQRMMTTRNNRSLITREDTRWQ